MSRTATVILAIVCVAAGAGGAFLALRSDGSPVAAAEQVQAEPAASSAVAESEGVIERAPVAAPAPVVSEPAAAPRSRPVQPPPAPRPPVRQTASARPPVHAEPQSPVVTPDQRTVVPIAPAAITDNQASRTVEPPAPLYEELVVAADSVIGLQLESPVSSDKAQVEDSVVARVTRDVKVGDRVAIPAGAKALGEVTLVERGGKLRERARLGVRFTSVVLADGTRLPLHTETIFREGDPPGRESAAKIGGGAIGGAILGGILGGAKGAAIGGSIGAGAGTAAVVAGDRNHATLSAGTPLTVRIEDPVVVTVEK
jgi:type IV secretory pathway VirB10-like protein